MAMPNRTVRSLGLGTGGVVGSFALFGSGNALVGVLFLLGGATLLILAADDERKRRPYAKADKAAAQAYRRAKSRPFTAPRAVIGDLAIIEKTDSTYWLAAVASVNREARVTAVTSSRGAKLKLSMIRATMESMRVVSADTVDVADAIRRDIARKEAKQEWTSREEVLAQLIRAKTPLGETPSK